MVANLDADKLDGIEAAEFLQRDGSVALTADWDVGAHKITAEQLASDIAIGTAPLIVTSTTVVSNLNVSFLEGYGASAFPRKAEAATIAGAWTFNAAIALDGDLDFVGAQSITTTAGDLTLAPAGGLVIDPGTTGVIINEDGDDFCDVRMEGNTIDDLFFLDAGIDAIGIGCTPDPQFILDVAGPLRAQVLVGPHAIQLADALAIMHFDGAYPFETNYTGETMTHMGVGPSTSTGGIIFRPGKFGKGFQSGQTATNLVTNPSFEVNITDGWTANNWETTERSAKFSVYGDYSRRVYDSSIAENESIYSDFMTVSPSTDYTLSVLIKKTICTGTGIIIINWYTSGDAYISNSTQALDSGTHDWQNYIITATSPATAAKGRVIPMHYSGLTVSTEFEAYIDAVQFEEGGHPTPYLDGSLGDGHSWSGTAHNSTSTRSTTVLHYDHLEMPEAWTVGGWFASTPLLTEAGEYSRIFEWWYDVDNYFRLLMKPPNNRISWDSDRGGESNSGEVTTTLVREQMYFFCVTFDGTYVNVFIDDAHTNVDEAVSGTYAGTPSTFSVGTSQTSAQVWNGILDDFFVLERALDSDEVLAIYESECPVFAETSNWAFRATPLGLVWADHNGLWVQDSDGDAVFGVYAGEDASHSWGGATLAEGDILFGRQEASKGWLMWDNSEADVLMGVGATTHILFDGSDGSAQFVGKIQVKGADGAIALGTTPPTSASAGTGIWLDRTGMYGLDANVKQFYLDAVTGAAYAGAGAVILDSDGITISDGEDTWNQIKFKSSSVDVLLVSAYLEPVGGNIGALVHATGANGANNTRLVLRADRTSAYKAEIVLFAEGTGAASGETITMTALNGTKVTYDLRVAGDLLSYKNSTEYAVYGFHPLTSPITHTSFSGTAKSDTNITKIENTAWSSTIPADAKALLIRLLCRDSGSATDGDLSMSLYAASGGSNPPLTCHCGGKIANAWTETQGIVPCTDGDIWHTINASGNLTLDVWMQVWGYWI